ncbi:MAG: hypothetical protein R2750_08055 [Bacteroidales bacterium]
MSERITIDFPFWFYALCIMAGFIYAFILYYRAKKNEFSPALRWVLAILRGVVVSIIAFLLLNPLYRSINRYTEKPLIIFAQDNSSSIPIGIDSAYYLDTYKNEINEALNKLEGDYEITRYLFGDKVRLGEEIMFADELTDISKALEEIQSRNTYKNVGAIIISSDGIINRGSNPLYMPFSMNVPVYTIALGDTSLQKDLLINDVNYNRIAYVNNEFPVEIIVNGKMFAGEQTRLTVVNSGKTVFSKDIIIRSNNDFQTIRFNLKAESAGLQRYSIRLDRGENEISYTNNAQDIFIDILEGKQKILLLANSPHPDITAIRQAIKDNVNYEFEYFPVQKFDKSPEGYNLVILHGLPSLRNNITGLLETVKKKSIPVLYFVTQQTQLPLFNKQQSGIEISSDNLIYNDVLPLINESFSQFSLKPATVKALENFSPVLSPYGQIQSSAATYSLLFQKIGTIKTSEPLLSFNHGLGAKSGIFLGEGIWKWRLRDFSTSSDHEAFNDIIDKTIQYMALKVDKSLFRVFHKNNFTQVDGIEFEAEVYNEIYSLIDDAEVRLEIVNSEGERYPFNFSESASRYYLNAGNLPADSYKYTATVMVGQNRLTKTGEFTVSSLNLEKVNTVADHNLLFNLAVNNGGQMLYPGQIKNIPEIIKSRQDIRPVSYTQEKYTELLNQPWLLILILFLLSTEWFIRKRAGGY